MKVPTILFILLLSFSIAHADNIENTKTSELVEWIVAKYYDAYLLQSDKSGEFHVGSSFTDRFHKEGLIRIVVSLPDNTQKIFDFDDRFSAAKPTKIEPTSNVASRLSFVLSQSTVSVTSTTHQSKYSHAIYQVWTLDRS